MSRFPQKQLDIHFWQLAAEFWLQNVILMYLRQPLKGLNNNDISRQLLKKLMPPFTFNC